MFNVNVIVDENDVWFSKRLRLFLANLNPYPMLLHLVVILALELSKIAGDCGHDFRCPPSHHRYFLVIR